MCQECTKGPLGDGGTPTRRRLLTWGLTLPAAAAVASVPFAGTASATESARRGAAFYVARSGDTLMSIAARFLGNEQRWTEILALNSRELGRKKQPRPGQRLVLPESPAGPRTRNFAPLPADAKPIPVPAEGYRLDKIGPNAYGVIVGAVQTPFVVTDAGVVVIDAPPGMATHLPNAIKRITDKPVTHFIYSHQHADHVGAADRFPDAIRISQAETARLLAAHKDPARPVPTVTFDDRHTLDVGGEKFVLRYPGANHDTGNILIHVPGQRLAVMMDIANTKHAPFRAFGNADSVPGVLRALNELVKLDIDTFVGGHMYRYGTPADVRETRDFVFETWTETGKAIAATPIADYFAKVEPGNTWAAIELWYDAIADKVEPVVLSNWITRLGAADVWLRENIKTMVVSHRTDIPKDL